MTKPSTELIRKEKQRRRGGGENDAVFNYKWNHIIYIE